MGQGDGDVRAHIHGHLRGGDVHEDHRHGLLLRERELPQRSVEQDGLLRRRPRTPGLPAGHGKLLGDQDGANPEAVANNHRRQGHAAARGHLTQVPAHALRRPDPGLFCVFHLRHHRRPAVHVKNLAAVRHPRQPRGRMRIVRLTGRRWIHGLRHELRHPGGADLGVPRGRRRGRPMLGAAVELVPGPRRRRSRQRVPRRPVLRAAAQAGLAQLWVQQL